MYASEPMVRSLAANVRSGLSLADIEAAASTVDAEIDAEMSASFAWPTGSDGQAVNDPPPAIVVAAANLLTAALIESRQYAQNEAGTAVANPYARSLERRGRALMSRITSGQIVVPGIERVTRVATTKAPQVHSPARGLSRRSGSWQ